MAATYIIIHSTPCVDVLLTEKISTAQQFLEIMMNAPGDAIIIQKKDLHESFFDLKSGLAGEILQKVVNYQRKLAIVGDFSGYSSESLNDLIRESNKGGVIIFVGTVEEVLEKFK